jgi:hypothetical protein
MPRIVSEYNVLRTVFYLLLSVESPSLMKQYCYWLAKDNSSGYCNNIWRRVEHQLQLYALQNSADNGSRRAGFENSIVNNGPGRNLIIWTSRVSTGPAKKTDRWTEKVGPSTALVCMRYRNCRTDKTHWFRAMYVLLTDAERYEYMSRIFMIDIRMEDVG